MVKVFVHHNGFCCRFDVGAGIHINRYIARTDTNGGVARTVGGANHRRTTGGQDYVCASVAHQRAGGLDGGAGQNLQSMGRTTGFFDGRLQLVGHCGAATQGHRVRGDDQRVTRHQAQNGLEDDGGHGRGGVGQAHHHAGWATDLDDAQRIVAAHTAQRDLVPSRGRQRASDLVLGDLVSYFANAAFANGPLGIKLSARQQGRSHFFGDTLGFFRRPKRKRAGCLLGTA